MLSYKPKRHPSSAIKALIILFICLIALTVLAAFDLPYKVFSQGLTFVIAAAILYILMRYVLTEYTYTVSDDKFEVSKVTGRIPYVIILIDIKASDKLIRISDTKDLKEHKIKRKENVCANLSPYGLYAYITEIDGIKNAILLECDELFAYAVTERINMKKLSEKESENSKDSEEKYDGI